MQTLQAQTSVSPNACGGNGGEDDHLRSARAPAPAQTLPRAAGKEVARTWADIGSTKLTCLAEGSLRKHKMLFTCAVHKPEVSMLSFKGHSGMCDKAENSIMVSEF